MDLEQVQRLAQAFARGLAFARGYTEMAQDAKDGEEEGHWVTIGGERGADGEKHGGRPVFISGSGTIKKGLSKSAQGKTLNEAFKELKKDQKGEKNDQIFRSMPRKEFADMFRSTGGDELSENNTLKIWYKDHTFKHFDYESDRKELARALRQPGIKAIAWSNEGDVGYYGSPNDIVMRNVNTNETKPLAEVQKDAGVGSLWVVDDVIDRVKSKQRAGKEAGERASTKRAKAEKDRRDATSRAKEFRQETKQIVANDLEPSVAKLKKALDANVPARVHDDLVDMHRLADQIGIMANKLCSLNSRYAENSKEPSAFVVSSHGQNAKGTAERVAKLARQSAAIAQDFGKPNNERSSGLYAHDKIRDNLSELRGLHQDLLDHIRRIQEPEKREEPQEDPLYAARGKVINGPARTSTTARGYVR